MTYSIEHIADKLKTARESKRLSQRALSEKVGVPQSHISKIENGAVDLKLSTLIELSRALDLEVMLVPRKLIPTVQGTVRGSGGTVAEAFQRVNQAANEIRRIFKNAAMIQKFHPEIEELQHIQTTAKELQHMRLGADQLQDIRKAAEQLNYQSIQRIQKSAKELQHMRLGADQIQGIRKAAEQLQRLRNAFVHRLTLPPTEVSPSLPAYRLDKEEYDG